MNQAANISITDADRVDTIASVLARHCRMMPRPALNAWPGAFSESEVAAYRDLATSILGVMRTMSGEDARQGQFRDAPLFVRGMTTIDEVEAFVGRRRFNDVNERRDVKGNTMFCLRLAAANGYFAPAGLVTVVEPSLVAMVRQVVMDRKETRK